MASHDKHLASSHEDGLPLMEKSSQWTPSDTMEAKTEQQRKRNPARRFFLAFLVCSVVLLGLASVHSPEFRQRFSCHGGMMGNLMAGIQSVTMDKETPQPPTDLTNTSFPNQLDENRQSSHQEGGEAYHAGAAPTTKLQLLRRETNSSSVAPVPSSQTAKTADPEPTAKPTASSSEPTSEPSSSAPPPPQTSSPSPSPTPSSPPTSGFQTSTTKPTSSAKNPTTKAPEPPTTSAAPPPPTTEVSSETSTVKSTSIPSSSTSSRGQAPRPTTPVDDEDDDEDDDDDDDVTHDTTIYTTRPANPTNPPPTTPKVIIETSTRTSNGQVVIVESTITVQPSPTQPVSVTGAPRPPASLQNAATRQEGRGMALAGIMAGAVLGVLL